MNEASKLIEPFSLQKVGFQEDYFNPQGKVYIYIMQDALPEAAEIVQ